MRKEKKVNPFPYTLDNKRYHTWNYYLKTKFANKVFKVPLNANFSCPNRDGTCGYGGCTFCGALGSGEYAGNIVDDLNTQFEKGMVMMSRKWSDGKPIAYFQAYTNTYAPLEELKRIYNSFVINHSKAYSYVTDQIYNVARRFLEDDKSTVEKLEDLVLQVAVSANIFKLITEWIAARTE